MAEKQEILFNFISSALPREKFALVRIDGREAISDLYSFSIDLVSEDPDIDTAAITGAPATIEIDRDGDIACFQGIVASFDQRDQGPEFVHYHAEVVPRLYALNLNRQSQIFQDMSVKEIIKDVLDQNNLSEGEDYDLKLTETYATSEYTVQYEETDLNFIRRLMEHEGIFFFFEHGEKKEKLIVADSSDAFKPIPGDPAVLFRDARAVSPGGEAVQGLVYRRQMQPAKVHLKDYNYRKPTLEVKGEAEAVKNGVGTIREYGIHTKDPDHGSRLAKVRSDEHRCRENLYYGEGAVRGFRSGATFTLQDHFRAASNQKYLLLEVEHTGRQLGIVGAASGGKAERPSYTNRFVAAPATIRFVPDRVTPRPRIYGTMHAQVDASGSGRYAEIDDMGRYKVKIPFDLSDKTNGKASRFIRMAQPYAGPEWGMHFPLHKGAEVLLTHVDGDPDRPIIAAAVPNPDNGSPVTQKNQTQCVLKSCSNNEIRYENQEGEEQIYVHGQKDWMVVMENDHDELIKHDQKSEIGNDRTEKVGNNEKIGIGNNRDERVEKNETISIGGNRTEDVTGNETLTVEKDRRRTVNGSETIAITKDQVLEVTENRTKTVTKDETIEIKKNRKTEVTDDNELKVGKTFALIAGDKIQLQTGDASITLNSSGEIEIKGSALKITGTGKIDVVADSDLTLKGSSIKQN